MKALHPLSLALLALPACLAPAPALQIRTFAPLDPPTAPSGAEGAEALRLAPVGTSSAIDRAMLWRRSETELVRDEGNRWIADPVEFLSERLQDALFVHGPYAQDAVLDAPRLEVRLTTFEGVPEPPAACVELVATLRDGLGTVSRSFAATSELRAPEPEALAEGIGHALDAVVLELRSWLDARRRGVDSTGPDASLSAPPSATRPKQETSGAAMARITLKGNPLATSGDLPETGSTAPGFTLVDTDLSEASLDKWRGKKVVLNIFPSLDTPVCAMSVRSFNERASGMQDSFVLCISCDLPFAQKRFCAAEGLDRVVPLSAFRDDAFGTDYGVRILDGPLAGLFARAIVVIDEAGRVAYTELVPEIAQEPDYDAALAALE